MRQRYADLGEIRMFYLDGGSGDPVVFLHGGFASSDSWSQQLPAVAPHHRVIAPDSRGHGRTTDGPGPITYAQLAEDLRSLLDVLGVGRAVFIGWSDGGAAALHLAIHHPERVRGLGLIGAPTHVDDYAGPTREVLGPVLDFMRDDDGSQPWSPRAQYEKVAPEPRHWSAFVAKMRAMWLASPTFSADELGRIAAPTLVLGTDRDEFLAPAIFERTARLIPGAGLVWVPGGTHALPAEMPQETNRALLAFLERIAAGG